MVAEVGIEAGAGKARRTPTTAQIIKTIRTLVARRLELMVESPMSDAEQEQKLLEVIARTTAKLEDLARTRGS